MLSLLKNSLDQHQNQHQNTTYACVLKLFCVVFSQQGHYPSKGEKNYTSKCIQLFYSHSFLQLKLYFTNIWSSFNLMYLCRLRDTIVYKELQISSASTSYSRKMLLIYDVSTMVTQEYNTKHTKRGPFKHIFWSIRTPFFCRLYIKPLTGPMHQCICCYVCGQCHVYDMYLADKFEYRMIQITEDRCGWLNHSEVILNHSKCECPQI